MNAAPPCHIGLTIVAKHASIHVCSAAVIYDARPFHRLALPLAFALERPNHRLPAQCTAHELPIIPPPTLTEASKIPSGCTARTNMRSTTLQYHVFPRAPMRGQPDNSFEYPQLCSTFALCPPTRIPNNSTTQMLHMRNAGAPRTPGSWPFSLPAQPHPGTWGAGTSSGRPGDTWPPPLPGRL